MKKNLPNSTPIYPKISKNKLLKIGEAAELVGVAPSTLRLWETKGLLSPKRTKLGTRFYSLKDLLKVQLQQ